LLGIVLGMVQLGSLVFAAPSSNGTICLVLILGILFLGRYLNRVALGEPEPLRFGIYSLYFVLPHLEWFNVSDLMIHDWPTIAWWAYGVALLYALFYTGIFVSAAALLFRRKALN